VAARHSSVACHTGDTYARPRSTPGSAAIGKYTPENSDSGMIVNRISSVK
jgi:hypothetical protein